MDVRDRVVGCLAGIAVCAALGTTLEFKQPGTFEPVDDMVFSYDNPLTISQISS